MQSPHRSTRPPSLRRLLGVALVQTLLFTVVPTVAWGATMLVSDRVLLPADDPSRVPRSMLAPAAEPGAGQAALSRRMKRWACSTDGLGDGVIPAHALVRLDGEVRLTSFDVGWAAYTGAGPGELVALCRR